jgi:hypothetical protein
MPAVPTEASSKPHRCQHYTHSRGSHGILQARDDALSEVEDLRHEVADLRRMTSPQKTLRMSRSDSEEELPIEQVRDVVVTPHQIAYRCACSA